MFQDQQWSLATGDLPSNLKTRGGGFALIRQEERDPHARLPAQVISPLIAMTDMVVLVDISYGKTIAFCVVNLFKDAEPYNGVHSVLVQSFPKVIQH